MRKNSGKLFDVSKSLPDYAGMCVANCATKRVIKWRHLMEMI